MTDRGTVTLLFTDLVGSTQLGDRLGDEAADRLRRAHFGALREAIVGRGGREVKSMGDGVMAAFGSAVDAIECAVDIQRRVMADNEDQGHGLAVRVGLNAGDALSEEGDYFGTAVNVAARLCAAADGGQILASELVRGLAGSRGAHRFVDRGRMPLKGISEPVGAWEVLWQEEVDGARSSGTAPEVHRAELPLALQAEGPFVGRSSDLERLDRIWTEVQGGARKLVMVAGEPGIGKTRLSAAVAGRFHEAGATVLYGRCDEETVVPYQPVVEALAGYARTMPDANLAMLLGSGGDEVGRLVPEIAARVSLPRAAPAPEPETQRYRLFEAVAGLLATIARTGPVVLVLDDLHWADKPSLLLLRHLIRSGHGGSLLLLGTYRETDLDRRHPLSEALVDLRREQLYERVLLRGLSQDEVTEFLAAAGQHEVRGRGLEFSEALHRETEGNPFFIGEILRHLIETGKLYPREGVWVFDAKSIDALGIPEGVRDVIGQRLSRLSSECNQVLSLGAVLGREFEFDVLARMTQADEADALSAVEEALEHSLVVEAKDRATPTYQFSHALVRQTLYDEMSLPRKQQLHLRAGQAVEAVHQADLTPYVAALAVHFRNAGAAADPLKVLEYSLRAGEAAAGVFGYEEALGHLEAALQLMEAVGAPATDRAHLLQRLGDLQHVTGIDRARGNDYLSQALAIFEAEGDDERAAQAHSRLGRGLASFPEVMDIPRALDHFRAAETVLAQMPERAPLGYVAVGLASSALWGNDIGEGMAAAQRAIDIAERLGNEGLWVNAAAIKGWFLVRTGRIAEGLALLDESWERADRQNHVIAAFFATWIGAFAKFALNDSPDAQADIQRELTRPRVAQAPTQRNVLLVASADSAINYGDLVHARRTLDELPGLAPTWFVGPRLAFFEGDWPGAEASFFDMEGTLGPRGVKTQLWGALWWAGHIRCLRGDYEGARAALDRGLAIMGDSGDLVGKVWFAIAETELAAETGDATRAVESASVALATMEGPEDWRALAGWVTYARGRAAAVGGDIATADRLFGDAVEVFQRYSAVWEESDALFNWGRMLQAAGEHEVAVEKLDAAGAIYRRVGAGQPWLARVAAARG